MKYTEITNPTYADNRNRIINCWVKFEDFSAPIPFTASPEDTVPHAKKILKELNEGKWGPIGAFNGNA